VERGICPEAKSTLTELSYNNGYLAYFSLRILPYFQSKIDVSIVFLDPDFFKGAKILALRVRKAEDY